MPVEQELLTQAKKEAVKMYITNPKRESFASNVVGVGIGQKITKGRPGDRCVRIYVERKISDDKRIPPAFFIAPEIEVESGGVKTKVKTDVIETPRFSSLQSAPVAGVTIGLGYDATNIDPPVTGRFGAIVKATVNAKDTYYALGANHVMAANGLIPPDKPLVLVPADRFLDPSRDKFADTTGIFVRLKPCQANYVDCALAKLENQEQAKIGASDTLTLVDPVPGMEVTQANELGSVGTIVDVDAYLRMDYSFGTFDLDHQVLIKSKDNVGNKAFARPRDSGNVVMLKDKNQATALIVGGFEHYAIACPLRRVFRELEVELKAQLKDELTIPRKPFKLANPQSKAASNTT